MIGRNEEGQRLDKYLSKYMDGAPKSFFYKMLRKKNITLNGKKAEGKEILKNGDIVKLFLAEDTIGSFQKKSRAATYPVTELSILYENDQIAFLNKPAGMLSQKSKPEDLSLNEYFIGYLLSDGQLAPEDLTTFRPSICNRLDRNTSGVVAAGKSLAGLQSMAELLRSRKIDKYYYAIVGGKMEQSGIKDAWILKDESNNQVLVLNQEQEGAQRIRTGYRPICSDGRFTFLEIQLITGKTHQIRAHLASMGHPVAGDFKYGDTMVNRFFRDRFHVRNQLLHAQRMEFGELTGPLAELSGRTIAAPAPPVFARAVKALFGTEIETYEESGK